jgi:hypothetical protein
MLPDKVVWTVIMPPGTDDPYRFVDQLNEIEGGETPEERWSIADVLPDDKLRLVRLDGRYRFRDDGFRGF